MRLQTLGLIAAVAVMIVSGQQLAAQQMSPYAMAGGYPMVAPMGYPAPLAPAPASAMNVRRLSSDPVADTGAGCTDCGSASCDGACDVCDCWSHRVAVFGEFLYLRARNAEVAYGVPIDGPIVAPPTNNPIQIGRVGMVDQDYQPGFRFGVSYVLDGWSSLTVQYARLESTRDDRIDTAAPNVIRSLVSHPGTLSAAQDFLSAQASHDITFDLLDADYRNVITCCDDRNIAWLVGVRAAQLNQDFDALFSFTGTENVVSEIDFYGGGLRFGLEGEKYSHSRRWLAYGKTSASLVAGTFTADFRQGQSFDPQVVDTTWKAGRIVPILDLEVGVGWQSQCGTWRLTAGYLFSGWYNTVKTDEFIKAVQSNNFVGLSDAMTFDGLVARVEGRF